MKGKFLEGDSRERSAHPSGDVPPSPIRSSALSRHQLDKVTPSSWAKPRTSLVLPGVDVAHEIEQINQGYGIKVGDSRYQINGRVYVVKPDGATYLESGDDVIQVSRPAFLALRLLIRHNGRTAAFHRETVRDPKYTEDVIREALALYELRQG